MSKMANRNYLLVDAGINYQIRCLQISGGYINVRDLCSSPPSRQSRKYNYNNVRFCVGTEIFKN